MRILIGFLCFVLLSSSATSKTLVTCGDLEGNSFFQAGGIVPEDQWKRDSVSPGRTVLITDDKGKITDIRLQDAAGWMSYKKDGCTINPVNSGVSAIVVIAVCKMSVDTYMFTYENSGRIMLLFSQVKSAPAITKVAAMKANCRAGD